MEKGFFLLIPCAVVATAVTFQENGYFSCPFLGFHIYAKIPIASLTLEKGTLPRPAPFAALFVTITYRKLRAVGAAGVLWLGGVRMGHAKIICVCIPPSKLQRDTTRHQTLIGRSI